MTALVPHLPPLANLLAFIALAVLLTIGWVIHEMRIAPRREDWPSSADARYARTWDHVDPDNLIEHDAALASIIARAEMVARDGERLWLGGGGS